MSLFSLMIEASEKVGQMEVKEKTLLPKLTNDIQIRGLVKNIKMPTGSYDRALWTEYIEKCNQVNAKYTKERYEGFGIEIISEYDDLFYEAKLPEGWEIVSHETSSFWSDLCNRDKKIASLFYKAAFYDRSAMISWEKESNNGKD